MRLLWHYDYWDGPLSGICLLDGREHFFQCKGEDDNGKRSFEIISLTDEEIVAERRANELFRTYVGNNCNYNEHNQRPIGDLKPKEEWHKFYDNPPAVNRSSYRNVVLVVSEDELKLPKP